MKLNIKWHFIIISIFFVMTAASMAKENESNEQKLVRALQHYYSNRFNEALPLFLDINKQIQNDDIKLWLGSSASQAGECELGIDTLKKLLQKNKDQQRIALELGSAYWRCGHRDLAKKEFDKVLASSPPESIKRQIHIMMQEDKGVKLRWKAKAVLGVQYDSNVNSGPDSAQINDSIAQINLLAEGVDAQEKDGINIIADINGDAMYDFGPPSGFVCAGNLNVFNSHNTDDTKFNYRAIGLGGGVNYLSQTLIFRAPVSLTLINYGDKSLSKKIQLKPSADYFLKNNLSIKGEYGFTNEAYAADDYKNNGYDNQQHDLRIGPSYYMNKHRQTITGLLNYSMHDADFKAETFDSIGLTLYFASKIGGGRDYILSYDFKSRTFDGKAPNYEKTRKENRHTLFAKFNQRFMTYGIISLEATYVKNDANADLYSFDKFTSTLSAGIVY